MYKNTIQIPITEFLDQTVAKLLPIPEAEWETRPMYDKWSKKEILGHLIDSAQNNIRRLVVSRYKPNDKIVYNQNEWVKHGGYQHIEIKELVQLWYLLNKQYHRISQNIPASSLDITCDTSAGEPMLRTLAFLIEDYWGHQQHHLKQLFEQH